jgi:hypothetical protein
MRERIKTLADLSEAVEKAFLTYGRGSKEHLAALDAYNRFTGRTKETSR